MASAASIGTKVDVSEITTWQTKAGQALHDAAQDKRASRAGMHHAGYAVDEYRAQAAQ